MKINRREFIRNSFLAGAAGSLVAAESDAGFEPVKPSPDSMGVLVDLSKCIGCRKCEFACNQEPTNGFKVKHNLRYFEKKDVFDTQRRHSEDSFCVINRFTGSDGKPVYVKSQCMHCVDPSCLSACLVTAFKKEPNGAIHYDASRCIGCRYCITVCPFEMPAYEFSDPLTPRVRKCTLCFDERTSKGRVPACVEMCPLQIMIYGKRSDLLKLAHEKINNAPGEYVDHVYGEHEMGGTSWLYISKEPFENLGFLKLSSKAPARLVEGIQHSIFRYFVSPLLLYGLLGMIMWNFKEPEGGTNE